MPGVSSVLHTAASLANRQLTLQDNIAADNFKYSPKTADDLAEYQAYLTTRIGQEKARGSTDGQIKALALTNTMISAIKANGSADIQRENIAIMSGNASLPDKYNMLSSQYVRAVSIGDEALAQSLMSQAYSVNQQIQYQAQQAQNAALTLAKSGASKDAAGQQSVARNILQSVTDLNRLIQDPVKGGQNALNTAVKKWVNDNKDSLLTLNPNMAQTISDAISKGAQPNYFDLLKGSIEAAANAHLLAAQAEMPYNPDTAQGYIDAATNLIQGQTIKTLGGSMTYQDIVDASSNPQMYSWNSSTQSFSKNPQVGTEFVPGKGVQATYAPAAPNNGYLTPEQISQIGALHLNVKLDSSGKASDGITVTTTDQSPIWVRNVLPSGSKVDLYNTPQGLQFAAPATNGQGQATFTIVADSTGKHGIAEESSNGTSILAGEYGFNPVSFGKAPSRDSAGNLLSPTGSGKVDRMGQIFQNPDNLITNTLAGAGMVREDATAKANAAAAKALLPKSLPPLPTITQAPVVAPPAISTNPVPSLSSLIAPRTVTPQAPSVKATPQNPNVNVGTPSNTQLQGGGSFQLQ